jgi:hypothetical protein
MDENAFRRHLKRQGKRVHVIDGLLDQVRRFEDFLARQQRNELDAATPQDLHDYVAELQTRHPGKIKTRIRGLGLYYQFAGNPQLASLAAAIREREIAKTRRVFKLKEFRGVNLEYVNQLESVGIVNVEQMLQAGKTPDGRQQLSTKSRVPLAAILELVKLSDLSRVGALKSVRARLYYDAGVDTPEQIAQWKPEELQKMLAEFVKRTGFDGIAPLPKEVRNAVKLAKALPRIVQYE